MENLEKEFDDVTTTADKIYVYRYMWLMKGNENLNVRILAGVSSEHEAFIDSLNSADDVRNACRVYLHEISIEKIENYETIKKENKEEENYA